ncbi:hypothetical protein A0E62_gp36 [Pyrobaculum filamentous virus 1]|uniref:Uncharacterized protein n=1 Tax=Pyrobaculum filamentous virus 1 TaxID=1805492 RepID=A0A140F3M2_PFV1|nr:hypothetical protein A0E62_gp36 [Pyrobaculum filamentous virus 1]AML61182.1 hypothetical protein [Pyrobaculum filamentous virus 1]
MASVVFIDRSNGKVLGQSDVYMTNMVALYGNGCVFALSVDDKLWEQIYVKFEVAKDVKYMIWGDFGEIRFDNYSVVILAPSELITEVVYHIKDKVKKVYKVIYEKEVKSLL